MDALTKEQMKEVDAIASEEFGISSLQMMEMAGFGVARLCSMLLGDTEKKRVLVAAGKGNNGADAVVAARYLKNWGAKPIIILSSRDSTELLKSQINTAEHAGVECFVYNELDMTKEIKNSDIVIDGLLGYGLHGDPRKPLNTIINLINSFSRKVLSVDIPSGLDATTGHAYNPCIKASATASLAILKRGFLNDISRQFTGSVYLIDIGIPPEIYAKFGINAKKMGKLFSRESIIRVL